MMKLIQLDGKKPLQSIRKGCLSYLVSFKNSFSLKISSKAIPTYVNAFGFSSTVFASSCKFLARRAAIVTNVYFELIFSCKLSTDGSSIRIILHYFLVLRFNTFSFTVLTRYNCLHF